MKYKVCSKCHTILLATADNFYRQKTGKYGLKAKCKRCEIKYKKVYYETHEEETKAYSKAYYETYYETHKEEIKARGKTYRQTAQGQVVVFNGRSRRRARLASNGGQITKEQWLECMNFFNWQCAYSGKKLTKDNRSLDHIVPVKAGGTNNIYNLVPMLKSLNSSKNDKDMLEWYRQQSFFDEARLQKIMEWMTYSKNKYMEVLENA